MASDPDSNLRMWPWEGSNNANLPISIRKKRHKIIERRTGSHLKKQHDRSILVHLILIAASMGATGGLDPMGSVRLEASGGGLYLERRTSNRSNMCCTLPLTMQLSFHYSKQTTSKLIVSSCTPNHLKKWDLTSSCEGTKLGAPSSLSPDVLFVNCSSCSIKSSLRELRWEELLRALSSARRSETWWETGWLTQFHKIFLNWNYRLSLLSLSQATLNCFFYFISQKNTRSQFESYL